MSAEFLAKQREIVADHVSHADVVICTALVPGKKAPVLVTRDMVNDVLKYKRLDGVDTALKAIAQAVFPGGRQAASFRDALPGLDMPVLALWGDADAIANVGDADGLTGAEVAVLSGIGHMPHMEAAGEVNARLAAHLAGADG